MVVERDRVVVDVNVTLFQSTSERRDAWDFFEARTGYGTYCSPTHMEVDLYFYLLTN